MESYYRDAFLQYMEDEAIYDGKFSLVVALPDGYDLTIPATGRAVVDELVANVVPEDFRINYPPRGISKKAQDDAEVVMRWCRAFIKHLRVMSADIDPLTDATKNLGMSGIAAWKMVPDWTLWPVLPDEDEAELRERRRVLLLHQGGEH